MRAWRRCIPAGLFLLLVASWGWPQPMAEEPKPAAPRPADTLLLVDQVADVLKMLPRAVILSPEKHKELMTELERLRKQVEAEKPQRPSVCHVGGKLESNRAQLTLRFEFRVEKASTIWLACGGKKTHITKATLDGKLAPIRSEADGYHVTVEGSDKDRLIVLEVVVPVQSKAGVRSVDLELPLPAIASLDLEVPAGLQDLRLNGAALSGVTLNKDRLTGSLGSLDRWQLSWREPQVVAGPMVPTATGTIEVTIDERQQATTQATLALQLESGRTSTWKLLLPPGAELKIPPEAEPRIAGIDHADAGPHAVQKIIRLKEASSDPLTVRVQVPAKGPLPRGGKIPVGPFAVLGAVKQTGTILVRSSARDLQPLLTPATETTPRPLTTEEQKQAPFVRGFKYDRVPLPEKAKSATGPGSYSLLDIEAEVVRGVIEARLSHVLRAKKSPEPGEPRLWEVSSALKARVVQPGVELLEIQLPPGSRFIPGANAPLRPIVEVKTDTEGGKNVLQLRLEREGWKEFTFPFRVRYDIAADPPREATFALPRPLEADRTGDLQVQVIAPDDLELFLPEKPNSTLEMSQSSPQEQVWKADPTADRVRDEITLAWRPYRPEVQANVVVDLTLRPREASIRQEIRLRLPRSSQRIAILRLPEGLTQPPQLVSGGKPVASEANSPTSRAVQVDGPADQEAVLVLEYSYPLPEEASPANPGRGRTAFTLPLVVAEQATQLRTLVRICSEPGTMPQATGKEWTEQPLEEVPALRRLPALVLRAEGVNVPLTLRYAEPSGKLPAVVARRALIRVQVQETQGQYVHASYQLQQLASRAVEVELPAPGVALANVRFVIDGNAIDHPEILDDSGERNEAGRIARLRLPQETLTRPCLLEIFYQFNPRGATSPLLTQLQPPILRGESGRVLTRWAISLPSGWVALAPEEGPGARRSWVRRGVLLASRPGDSLGELETWLAGTETPAQAGDPALANLTLVCWRTGVTPTVVYHVPSQIWLLVCSLTTLVLGLAFVFWWRRLQREEASSARLLVTLVLLALVPAVLSLWFPMALSAILYGSEPGLAVLVLVVVVQWWAHERERRQSVLLSSFRRGRPPSTVIRPPSVAPVPMPMPVPMPPSAPAVPQPSTVDSPPGSGT